MKTLSRSTALKIAAILLLLISMFDVVSSIPDAMRGAQPVGSGAIPFVVTLIGLIVGSIGIVAAYGTWRQQRWGIVLAVVAAVVNGLTALPGVLFAPILAFQIDSAVTAVLAVCIVVLCLWRERKPALA